MTREELDFIGSMNMCDEISNEAYKKIVCHCEGQEPCPNAISRQDVLDLAKKGVLVSNGNYGSVCKAINELPSVNPQPCEDAISRQAVLVSIKNLYPDMPVVDIMGSRRKWLDKYAPYFECENAIERLPSVNPQPKEMM